MEKNGKVVNNEWLAHENSVHQSFIYMGIKRIIDIIFSAVGLIFSSPLFLVIAILMKVKEPDGPIFFNHQRNGKNGKKFKMMKFRSMCMNAEEILLADPVLYAKFKANGYKLDEGEDPRITAIGAFIRKISIDELPQLWNVFTGSMSLVGPRPIPDKELEEYGESKEKFLSVKPGVTGLWQVSGRSKVMYPERCELELNYVDQASLTFDLMILLKTVKSVLLKEGAY